MEFKIDTKDTFATIMPLEQEISAKLTGELWGKLEEMWQSGSKNFIVDLQPCVEIEKTAVKDLVGLHELSYGQGQSLVWTGMCDKILHGLKEAEADQLLNIAPTMAEAVDIVSMEILERELMSEE